jgi:hypothetical protein
MATTLLQPKVKIISGHIDDYAFKLLIEETSNYVRGLAVSDTMKLTWLKQSEWRLIAIFEWCEWANEDH